MITVNGEPTEFEGSITDLVSSRLGEPTTGIAVALNGEVVARSSWSSRMPTDGDRIEIVTAVQGG